MSSSELELMHFHVSSSELDLMHFQDETISIQVSQTKRECLHPKLDLMHFQVHDTDMSSYMSQELDSQV